MAKQKLRPPYQWFGGKAAVADLVWSYFNNIDDPVVNFVDPFFGGGAMLLLRPRPFKGKESINDINAWVCNFWRAVRDKPDEVAKYADWPISELDLHARGDWLFYRKGVRAWVEKIRSDPEYYDAKSAGWWVWGLCCWIGSGWGIEREGGEQVGVHEKKPAIDKHGVIGHVKRSGKVTRQVPEMKPKGAVGVSRIVPYVGRQGVHRMGLKDRNAENCIEEYRANLRGYIQDLAERMHDVRICCGDWRRLVTPTITWRQGTTAVFLDPPYAGFGQYYDRDGKHDISDDVREWAVANGGRKDLRICLCGYMEEHEKMLEEEGWTFRKWAAQGGYMKDKGKESNRFKERLWFSPHCSKGLVTLPGLENGGIEK